MTTISALRGRASLELPAACALVVASVYGVVILYGMNNWSYDVWGALIIGPALIVLSLPLLRVAVRGEADPRTGRILKWALFLKLCGGIANFVVSNGLYGRADSQVYSAAGSVLAHQFRTLDFSHLPPKIPGTGFIDVVTGFVYAITGDSFIGGYLIFSWFGFWGIYFFYRGVVLALPCVDTTRFAKLVFFLPSMLFWPSNIGKDAWVTLGIGIAVWGMGRMVAGLRNGFITAALGLGITVSTRPNITAILFGALFIGYLVRPSNKKASTLGPIYKFVGIVGMLAGGFVVISQAKDFFGVNDLSVTSVQNVIASTTQRTSQGGSSFQAVAPHTSIGSAILHFPQSILTVLFRPYPWQAHNLQSLIAAAEGFVLLLLTIYAWPRLRTIGRRLREPLVVACVVYTLEFIYAFSAFGNFGILTRERVQVFPFFLVLISLRPLATKLKPAMPPFPYRRPLAHTVRHIP